MAARTSLALAAVLAATLSCCASAQQAETPTEPGDAASAPYVSLMALGSHDSYATPGAGPFGLLVVSPQEDPAGVLAKARRDQLATPVLAYLNTMDVMVAHTVEPAAFWDGHEDWFLHGADGARVRIRVRSYTGDRARYGMNVAQSGWQAYLAARAVALLGVGYDGLQLDNVETDCSYVARNLDTWISALPVELTAQDWDSAEVALLTAVRAAADAAGFADRQILFNHIRAGEPETSLQYLQAVDGANSEGWMTAQVELDGRWGWRSRVDLVRAAAAAGKCTNLLALDDTPTEAEARFCFTSYLMAYRDGGSTFWYGDRYRAEALRWYPFYAEDLGAPAGDMAEVAGGGVFMRAFARGLVLVNPGDVTRQVELPSAWQAMPVDSTGSKAGVVTLAAKEGRILVGP